MSSGQKKIVE